LNNLVKKCTDFEAEVLKPRTRSGKSGRLWSSEKFDSDANESKCIRLFLLAAHAQISRLSNGRHFASQWQWNKN